MGSVFNIIRSNNGKKIQYRVIKYKFQGKWKQELLGRIELVPKGLAREILLDREWENERELSRELNKWVQYYNRNYLHSAHGYRTPIQAEDEFYKNIDEGLLDAA